MGRNTLGRQARKKGATPPEVIQKGIDLHLSGLSIRKAAKDSNIPYPTLRRYILKYGTDRSCRLEPNYDASKVFTVQQEDSLKEYILDCANKFYGLKSKDCRRIAYQMAAINKIKKPPSWEVHEMAGRDWMRGFRARHPDLSVKKPEACSIARATAFNKFNVQKFFNNLKEVFSRNPTFANGSRVYNLDETSTTTVQRPQKVLAAKGNNVCKVTSGERGVLVTTCCIVNAIGQALPPAMVFPRKNFKSHMLHGAPPGTLGLAAPSGWMNAQLFVEVMKHFVQHSSSSKDNPALLILDNHESHLSIEALDVAKASGVTILTLHPHTTARMQPLDVGLNGPFKSYYNSAVDSWLLRNAGKTLTIYNIAECVGTAYLRAMTPMNITQAFKKCGIFPFDDQIFTDLDFLPSEVTNRPAPGNVTDDETNFQESDSERCGSPSILTPGFYDDDEPEAEFENIVHDRCRPGTCTPVPSTSYAQQPLPISFKNDLGEEVPPTIQQAPAQLCPISMQSTLVNLSSKVFSAPKIFISPKIFRPPLKAEPRKNKSKRKPGKSVIATDTPEKNALAGSKTKIKKAKMVKTALFTSQKRRKSESSTSGEEEEIFISSGSSSGGEIFLQESDDEEVVLSDNFPPLSREIRPGDYVVVAFTTKKTKVYYVAQILEELEDCEYYVSFFKLKGKTTQIFSLPLEPDTAGVNIEDIMYILPPPITKGTARRQATYKFPIDMSKLNLRY